MTGRQRALRWLAAGVLVLWCGVFLRAENTEKSMVRALLLTPPTVVAQSWTVGLLYQFPEAAADASDAAAKVQLCTGRGNTQLVWKVACSVAMPSRYILDTAVQSSGIMGRTVISLIFLS